MKKIFLIVMIATASLACNNSADTGTDNDSINYQENKDLNNRNTTVYDSAAGKQSGDTSSYERMPDKINDSTPH